MATGDCGNLSSRRIVIMDEWLMVAIFYSIVGYLISLLQFLFYFMCVEASF